MLDGLHRQLLRIATRQNMLILVLIFIGVNLLMLSPISPFTTLQAYSGGAGLLDVAFLYTPDDAYEVLAAYGPAGRHYYSTVLAPIDFFTPILMNLFLSTTITMVFRHAVPANDPRHKLNLLPVIAMAGDYLENLAIVGLILAYPTRIDLLAVAASFFTAIKFMFTFASLGSILYGLALRLRRAVLSTS
jgi:hypothetical protein